MGFFDSVTISTNTQNLSGTAYFVSALRQMPLFSLPPVAIVQQAVDLVFSEL
jgi:hypothetical protein